VDDDNVVLRDVDDSAEKPLCVVEVDVEVPCKLSNSSSKSRSALLSLKSP
jgi:hypothetical protein